MATVVANIRWADNTAQLKANLMDGVATLDAMKSSVDRTVASLSGTGLFQAANKAAAAVAQLGDTTKLTGAEQDRIAALLDKAIEKYQAMGMTAPPAMLQVRDAIGQTSSKWDEFVSGFDPRAAIADPIGTARQAIGALTDTMGPAIVAGAAAVATLAAVGAAAYELADKAAAVGANIQDMSEKTGISVPALSNLKGAAEIAGGSLDQVSGAIFMFQRNMIQGTRTFTDGMGLIGLSVGQIRNLSPDQQFIAIAEAIQKVQDPAARSAAAMDLFGRQGRDLLPLLMKPIGDLVQQSQALGLTWSTEDAAASEEFEMKSRALRLELDQLSTNVGRDLIPVLSDLTTMLTWMVNHPSIKLAIELGFGSSAGMAGALTGTTELQDLYQQAGLQLESMVGGMTAPKLAVPDTGVVTDVALAEKELAAQHAKVAAAAKQAAAQQKAWTDLLTEFNSVGVSVTATLASMSGTVVAGAEYYLEHGMAVEKVAKFYGLTHTQIQAIQAALKDEQAELKATTAALIAHEDQVLHLLPVYTDWASALPNAELVTQSVGQTATTLANQIDSTMGLLPDRVPQARKAIADALKPDPTELETIYADVAHQIPSIVQNALTGGGGMAGASKAIGSLIGTDVGKSIIGSADDGTGILGSLTNPDGLVGGLVKSIPVIGSMLGPLLSKLFSLGGPSQAELQGRQTEAQFEQAQGGWQGIQQALLAAGDSADVANAKIQQLWAAEKQGSAAVQTVINSINADIAAHTTLVSTSVTSVLDAAKVVGSNFPAALAPMLSQLLALPGLTDQEKTSLQGLLGTATPSFAQMSKDASALGISIDALGPKFQQANVSQQADSIVQTFKELLSQGGDLGGMLEGSKAKFGDLVETALQDGASLPTAMQPWIKNLVDTGQLVDSAGKKITDVSNLKFNDAGDPLATGMDNLTKTLQNLIDVLTNKIPAAAQTAADQMAKNLGHIDMGLHFSTDAGSASYAATGGLVTGAGVQYLGSGGTVLSFVPRGSDTVPAMLTPGEGVLSRRGMSTLGAAGLAALNSGRSSGAAGEGVTLPVTLAIDGRTLAQIMLPLTAAELRRLRLA